MLATPIQMAQAMNIFANKGEKVQLHLVKSLKYANSKPIAVEAKRLCKFKEKNSSNWQYITEAMKKVITFGTGKRFGHHNLPFAAKTGTAQLIKDSWRLNSAKHLSDHSWFIGFIVREPVDFSITVLIENDNDAILIARDIIDDYFDLEDH